MKNEKIFLSLQDNHTTDMDCSIIHPFETSTPLPEQMNSLFSYEPHPICREALEKAMPAIRQLMEGETEGKMFGVLICKSQSIRSALPLSERQRGKNTHHPTPRTSYLIGYSGQIRGRSDWPGFVPAVFDYLQPDGYFKHEEAVITALNHEITLREQDSGLAIAREKLQRAKDEATTLLNEWQTKMVEARDRRHKLRTTADLDDEKQAALIRESQFMKAEFRRKKKQSAATIAELKEVADSYTIPIEAMKKERRERSDALQEWLFRQFKMLNEDGKKRDLIEIFKDTALHFPPGGAGECCEPKLLQYAYAHHLHPIQMAMFWIGPSPKNEIRHDGHFYPACQGKCKPILQWMLPDTQPITYHSSLITHQPPLPIIYEDDDIIVVNKPAGLLSVPGLTEEPSVLSIMNDTIHHHPSPITNQPTYLVHRLDQPTSGLLIIGKTQRAFVSLQRQFENRQVQKTYVALLEHSIDKWKRKTAAADKENDKNSGFIDLPLYSDLLNRPYQSVDTEHGKRAVTEYKVIGETDGHMRVLLMPKTGRTHQLRVHCAHEKGLANPILGDRLYGSMQAQRLYLHAESLRFRHPTTGKEMYLTAPAEF